MHRETEGIFAALAVRTLDLPNATKSLKLPINKVKILGRSQSNCDSGGSTIMYPRDTQKATYGSLLFCLKMQEWSCWRGRPFFVLPSLTISND